MSPKPKKKGPKKFAELEAALKKFEVGKKKR
jgi:hypothetical protein